MILSALEFAIGADDLVLTVYSGTLFPQNQIFDIKIDDEIMHGSLITGNVISVNRAQHGTAAASHIAGTPVNLIILVDKYVYDLTKSVDDVITGMGTVDYYGTPVANDIARFKDINTIEGRSYSELLSDLGVEAGATKYPDTGEQAFLDADHSKLDGIEAGADVTDAGSVDAAGAVMNSDTSVAAMGIKIDEDDMASNLDTKFPTQQSVKAYADSKARVAFPNTTVVSNATSPNSTWTDLDLSAVVGANQAVVLLRVWHTYTAIWTMYFRRNGDTTSFESSTQGDMLGANIVQSIVGTATGGYAVCVTDASGVIEWTGQAAIPNMNIAVEAYIR